MSKRSIFGLDPDQLNELMSLGSDVEGPAEDSHQDTDIEKGQKDGPDAASAEKSPPEHSRAVEGQPTASLIDVEQPGSRIGRYKLLRVLGEGGMGMVYLAEQEGQIRRRVALKIIKPGMDSKRVIARFETERQALALLDHPNIAQVYDAGTTAIGRPYFVMEHVKGSPITEYCDRHKLSIEDRLVLFQQVCHAVHHAHQKGIIHRDIKPSNILVSAEGDRAVPKIIDFGVAKAMSQPLTERTLFTEDSQLLGTPEYMSPEQAEMANEDIDTRSDIYSLGVLLYVLLAGMLPYDSQTFRQGGVEQIRKVIHETDPKTPSTRLTRLGEEAKKLAENRRTELATLAKRLHRELEWIPLKAMRKDRAERYRSASELADDIENYLNGAPLMAGPLGTGYKLKKFVRRNRLLVGGIAVLMIVLAVGVLVSTVFAVSQARTRAEMKLIIDFLDQDVLGAATKARVGEATVGFILDSSSDELETRFSNKPLIQAQLCRMFGETYRNLGEYEKATQFISRAIEIYKRCRGGTHKNTLLAMWHIGWVYIKQEKFREMEQLMNKVIEIRQQAHGVKHPLAEMHGLACAYYGLGKYKDAESLFNELLANMPHEYFLLPNVKAGLAGVYTAQGRYQEAEPLYEEVKIYPGDIANMYRLQERYEKAESLIEETLQKSRLKLGERHYHTLKREYVCLQLYMDQNRNDEAETLASESLGIARGQLRKNHPLTLRFINARAVLHTRKAEYDEAARLFQEALKGQLVELDDDHPDLLKTKNDFGVLCREQAHYKKAESLLQEAYTGRAGKLGPEHPHTVESLKQLIKLYEDWNKPDEAETWRVKLQHQQGTE